VGLNGIWVGLLGEGEKLMGKGVSVRKGLSLEGQRRTCMISWLLFKSSKMAWYCAFEYMTSTTLYQVMSIVRLCWGG
jgi:hypothetical protein